MTATPLAAAAATVDITPPAGMPMAGYAARRGNAVDTHDPLQASLLWLTDGHADVVWIALDAAHLDAATCRQLRDRVAKVLGVALDAVLVCASHTHSGPDGWMRPPYAGFPSTVDKVLVDALTETVTAAAGGLRPEPVQARWAIRADVGVGANRNDPAGPHDDSTGVLTLRGESGVVAVLADYACHPTVLGADNLSYSADYPGAARAVVDVPVLAFLQGAAGDASTRFTRRDQSFDEMTRLGGLLGAAVSAAVTEGIDVLGSLTVRRSTVSVPVRQPADPQTLARALTEVVPPRAADEPSSYGGSATTTLQDVSATPAARIAQTRQEGAALLAALSAAELPATMELPITAVVFGDLAWIHLPIEPFASFGSAIAARSRHPITRVVGYTDGYFGYLADAGAYASDSYEARSSLLDSTAGDQLVAAAVDLLNTP